MIHISSTRDILHKTKIVCTLGPSSNTYEKIEALAEAGMDVARLNFSYGNYEEFGKLIRIIRDVAKKTGKPIGIMQDLQGPKIRLGTLSQPLSVSAGQTLFFRSGHSGKGSLPIVYPRLGKDLKKGERILFGDGGITFRVNRVESGGVHAKAVSSGILKTHQGVQFPDSRLHFSFPTAKDVKDLEFGLNQRVDFVALSFVRTAGDIQKIKYRLRNIKEKPDLISKIETLEGVQNMDAILRESDGIIVARGDLGLQMGLEEIPLLQKKLIHKAASFGKYVITATQMLESMIEKNQPTRAEVSDVANSVFDGTDAVLLSGETAAGRFPVEAVEMLGRTLARAEKGDTGRIKNAGNESEYQSAFALAEAARDVAEKMGIDRIVPFTYSGGSALKISKFRPQAWIIAMTPQQHVRRKMSLYYGVYPILTRMIHATDEMFSVAEKEIKRLRLYGESSSIVMVAGIPIRKTSVTNLLKIHSLRPF
jgi:pyruvate kinase